MILPPLVFPGTTDKVSLHCGKIRAKTVNTFFVRMVSSANLNLKNSYVMKKLFKKFLKGVPNSRSG